MVLAENVSTNGGRCTQGIPDVCSGGQADTVHHTMGRGVTGDDPRYLAATCTPCNLHIGDPTKKNPQPKRVSRW